MRISDSGHARAIFADCLGQFSLRSQAGPRMEVAPRRARRFLMLLIVSRHNPLTHARIAEALWPEHEVHDVAHRIHLAASAARDAMRTLVGDFGAIQSSNGAYRLHPSLGVETDYEQLLHAYAERRIETMRRAVGLYRGEFLPGEDGDWAIGIRVRCANAYVGMLECLAEDAFCTCDHQSAIDYGLRALEADPAHEGVTRLVMRSYAANGRRAEVSALNERLAAYLDHHLGVAPSDETQRLLDRLLRER